MTSSVTGVQSAPGARAGRRPIPTTQAAGLPRLGALALACVLAACADAAGPRQAGSGAEAGAPYRAEAARSLLAAGYGEVAEIYIEPLSLAALAVAGLQGLSEIDPELSCRIAGGRVILYRGGTPIAGEAAPPGAGPAAWAGLTARLVAAGRKGSPELARASGPRIHRALFAGMLTRLDRYSTYAGPGEAGGNRARRHGFAGIGVRVRAVDEGALVIAAPGGTPASRGGLAPGDLITHVDGLPLAGLEHRQVEARLRGAVETRVRLTVRPADGGPGRRIWVTRSTLVARTVAPRRIDDVAYLELSRFSASTAETVRAALAAMAEAGAGRAPLAGVILDLRDNPGGLLEEAVEVADLFLVEGRIVAVHGRHPQSHQIFEADGDEVAADLPLVVLVNGASASAAEIVAAALKDAARAVLVGSATYGKGTVQTVNELPNDGELVLTWAQYLTPAGHPVERAGLSPAVCTSAEGVEGLEDGLRAAAAGDCPRRRARGSLDMRLALELLREPALYARALARQAAPWQAWTATVEE